VEDVAAAAIAGGRGLGTMVGEVRVAEGDSCNAVVSEGFDRVRDVVGVFVGFAEVLLLVAVEGFWDISRVGFAFAFFVGRELVSLSSSSLSPSLS
jgi:hypothetical protein